ncbi:MAG: hypothetical protein J5642_01495 [Bacteroidales bacterium]|nr:hypothetical protein [Bacteroidales bacterium]
MLSARRNVVHRSDSALRTGLRGWRASGTQVRRVSLSPRTACGVTWMACFQYACVRSVAPPRTAYGGTRMACFRHACVRCVVFTPHCVRGYEDGVLSVRMCAECCSAPHCVRGYEGSVPPARRCIKCGTAIVDSSCQRHEIPVTLHKRSAVQGDEAPS